METNVLTVTERLFKQLSLLLLHHIIRNINSANIKFTCPSQVNAFTECDTSFKTLFFSKQFFCGSIDNCSIQTSEILFSSEFFQVDEMPLDCFSGTSLKHRVDVNFE